MTDLSRSRYECFMAFLTAMGIAPDALAKAAGIPPSTLHSYVQKGGYASMKGDSETRIAAYFGVSVESIFGPSDDEYKPVSYVSAWRELKGLSLDDLSFKSGLPLSMIECVENGQVPLTGKMLRRVADALGVSQGFLLMDPQDAANSHIVAAQELPPDQKPTAARVLKALAS